MAVIKWYQSELDRVLYAPGGPVGRYANLIARAIAAEASGHAATHSRTGKLAAGYKVTVERKAPPVGFVFTVSNNVKGVNPRRTASYAASMEFGARPHPIRTRSTAPGSMLVFTVNGRRIVTKKVNHPGNRPYSPLGNALGAVQARMGF